MIGGTNLMGGDPGFKEDRERFIEHDERMLKELGQIPLEMLDALGDTAFISSVLTGIATAGAGMLNQMSLPQTGVADPTSYWMVIAGMVQIFGVAPVMAAIVVAREEKRKQEASKAA